MRSITYSTVRKHFLVYFCSKTPLSGEYSSLTWFKILTTTRIGFLAMLQDREPSYFKPSTITDQNVYLHIYIGENWTKVFIFFFTLQWVFLSYREPEMRSRYDWLELGCEVGVRCFLFHLCLNCHVQRLMQMDLISTYCHVWLVLSLRHNNQRIIVSVVKQWLPFIGRHTYLLSDTFIKILKHLQMFFSQSASKYLKATPTSLPDWSSA